MMGSLNLSTWSGNRTRTPKNTSLSRARLPIPPSRLQSDANITLLNLHYQMFYKIISNVS